MRTYEHCVTHVIYIRTKPDRGDGASALQNFILRFFRSFTTRSFLPPSTLTMAVVKSSQEMDYAIKPEALTPSIPTSEWPLLLKDYDKCTLPKKRKKRHQR